MTIRSERGCTLLTGATGFLGHVLLAELLRRGHSCAVLVRNAAPASQRLLDLLAEIRPDALAAANERVVFVEGELPDAMPRTLPVRVGRVVHAAACTRFEQNRDGDPYRTNAIGTANLLRWCEQHEIREFHLVSTAYACGVTKGPVPERVMDIPGTFRNAYEHSKWTAERHTRNWTRTRGRSCTILRPSIVVGDYATGRASRLNGLYLALRAFERCVTRTKARGAIACRTPIRLEGCADGRLNFIPVDHVARTIAHIIGTPSRHGVVYNLVDPCPITNQSLLDALQRYHGVSGCRFVESGLLADAQLSDAERSFAFAARALRPHIVAPPVFDRAHTAAIELEGVGPWPAWDAAALHRLISTSQGDRPMSDAASTSESESLDPVAAYFERFLPERLGRSVLAGMTELTTTFRFIVDGVHDGEWVCRFHEGRLVGVKRGVNGIHEDFAYRMGTDAFFDIVGARSDPQEIFLEGRAEVIGDIEQALKMGMILQQFNREHPYTCAPVLTEGRRDA